MGSDSTDADKRWRLRFSLRTLLIVTTVFGAGFGVVFNKSRRQRLAAEAVQAAHGQVIYDWQIRFPNDTSTGPPSPPVSTWLRRRLGPHWFDEIVEVRLNEHTNPAPANRFAVVGPKLIGLASLRSLSLRGEKRGQVDYDLLGQLAQLEKLRLNHRSVVTEQHGAAIAGARGLNEFHLDAPISTQALQHLAKLPSLHTLGLQCTVFEPATGRALKEQWIGDEQAEAISTLPHLHVLQLLNTVITDDGVAALTELAALEKLTVSSHLITGASLDHVAKLPNLKFLGTWTWQLCDDDLVVLNRLPLLEKLDLLTSNKLTDDGLRHIVSLNQLTWLRLRGDEITDDGIHFLHKLTNLDGLDLGSTSVNKYGVAAQQLQAAIPNCKIRLPKTDEEKRIHESFINSKRRVFRSDPPIKIQLTPKQLRKLNVGFGDS